MLRMSKLADYAALMLATMAEQPAASWTAAALAEQTGIRRPTASKLLKMLTRAKLVTSRRGTHGGYSLARPPNAISAVDMIEAIEGPLGMTQCSLAPGLCDLESTCPVSSQWQRLSLAVRHSLAEITLADLVGDPIVPTLSLRRKAPSLPLRLEAQHGSA